MTKKVRITHPEVRGIGECFEESLPAWLAAGWTLAPTPEPTTQTFPTPPKDAKAGFFRGKTANTPVVNLNQESPGMDLEETI